MLGDELDSPRGRIYLMKDMLEGNKPATPQVVKHIDRCLSCLSCMTTCPSGVHYMHLVDHGRAYIEATYRRPWHDRVVRTLLAQVLPYPNPMRLAMMAALLAKPFKGLVQCQQLTNLLDPKAEFSRAADKPQPLKIRSLVGPVPSRCPFRLPDQPDALIVCAWQLACQVG